MTMIETKRPTEVEILILGAGWTSTFLIPILKDKSVSFAATTTTGRDGTYRFRFEHNQTEERKKEYESLPYAKTVLITFPLRGEQESSHLVNSYTQAHSHSKDKSQFIQLGSSGIWSIPEQDTWVTRHSKYNTSDARAIAEDELISLGGCVMNLSGLWGGARQTKNWLDRVASTKEQLKAKTSLHMIHGLDVARSILAVHQNFSKAAGQRWMLTDLIVYDWWTLVLDFAGQLDAEKESSERETGQIKWVGELMAEQDIRALPRSMEQLGRCYDTREFWRTFGLMPIRARL